MALSAQDQKQLPLLEQLIELMARGDVKLIALQIVVAEFQKNRQPVAERAQRSFATHYNLVKGAI